MFGSGALKHMRSKYYFAVLFNITGILLISRPVVVLKGKL
jgi:hypothetical protein